MLTFFMVDHAEVYCVQTGFGPPYALLQGSLEDLSTVPPREETIVTK